MKALVIIAQAILSILLIAWPILLLSSALLFDAPGSEANLGTALFAVFLCFLPVFIGLIAFFFSWKLFFVPPKYLLLLALVLSTVAFFVLGISHVLLNALKK